MPRRRFAALPALAALLLAVAPAAAQAPQGGTMTVTARDADQLIAALKSHAGRNAQAAQAALALQILRGLGRSDAGPHGPELRYEVTVTADGRLLINGLDVSAVIQAVNPPRR